MGSGNRTNPASTPLVGFSHTQLTDFGDCVAIITDDDDFKNKK